MTENDKLFFSALNQAVKTNQESKDKVQIVTFRAALSNELLETLGLNELREGGWCMGVYVAFEPLYRFVPAETWMLTKMEG